MYKILESSSDGVFAEQMETSVEGAFTGSTPYQSSGPQQLIIPADASAWGMPTRHFLAMQHSLNPNSNNPSHLNNLQSGISSSANSYSPEPSTNATTHNQPAEYISQTVSTTQAPLADSSQRPKSWAAIVKTSATPTQVLAPCTQIAPSTVGQSLANIAPVHKGSQAPNVVDANDHKESHEAECIADENDVPQYPIRPDQPNCNAYMVKGWCVHGSACWWNHPPRKEPKASMKKSDIGVKESADKQAAKPTNKEMTYPVRAGEPNCIFYIRHGWCKHGERCFFNHPPAPPVPAKLKELSLRLNQQLESTAIVRATSTELPKSSGHITKSKSLESSSGLHFTPPEDHSNVAGSQKNCSHISNSSKNFESIDGDSAITSSESSSYARDKNVNNDGKTHAVESSSCLAVDIEEDSSHRVVTSESDGTILKGSSKIDPPSSECRSLNIVNNPVMEVSAETLNIESQPSYLESEECTSTTYFTSSSLRHVAKQFYPQGHDSSRLAALLPVPEPIESSTSLPLEFSDMLSMMQMLEMHEAPQEVNLTSAVELNGYVHVSVASSPLGQPRSEHGVQESEVLFQNVGTELLDGHLFLPTDIYNHIDASERMDCSFLTPSVETKQVGLPETSVAAETSCTTSTETLEQAETGKVAASYLQPVDIAALEDRSESSLDSPNPPKVTRPSGGGWGLGVAALREMRKGVSTPEARVPEEQGQAPVQEKSTLGIRLPASPMVSISWGEDPTVDSSSALEGSGQQDWWRRGSSTPASQGSSQGAVVAAHQPRWWAQSAGGASSLHENEKNGDNSAGAAATDGGHTSIARSPAWFRDTGIQSNGWDGGKNPPVPPPPERLLPMGRFVDPPSSTSDASRFGRNVTAATSVSAPAAAAAVAAQPKHPWSSTPAAASNLPRSATAAAAAALVAPPPRFPRSSSPPVNQDLAGSVRSPYTVRIGHTPCSFFVRHGWCAFRSTCDLHHPRNIAVSGMGSTVSPALADAITAKWASTLTSPTQDAMVAWVRCRTAALLAGFGVRLRGNRGPGGVPISGPMPNSAESRWLEKQVREAWTVHAPFTRKPFPMRNFVEEVTDAPYITARLSSVTPQLVFLQLSDEMLLAWHERKQDLPLTSHTAGQEHPRVNGTVEPPSTVEGMKQVQEAHRVVSANPASSTPSLQAAPQLGASATADGVAKTVGREETNGNRGTRIEAEKEHGQSPKQVLAEISSLPRQLSTAQGDLTDGRHGKSEAGTVSNRVSEAKEGSMISTSTVGPVTPSASGLNGPAVAGDKPGIIGSTVSLKDSLGKVAEGGGPAARSEKSTGTPTSSHLEPNLDPTTLSNSAQRTSISSAGSAPLIVPDASLAAALTDASRRATKDSAKVVPIVRTDASLAAAAAAVAALNQVPRMAGVSEPERARIAAPTVPAAGSGNSSESAEAKANLPNRPGKPECRSYLRTGHCGLGSSCQFHHPPKPAAAAFGNESIVEAKSASGEQTAPPTLTPATKNPESASLSTPMYPQRPGKTNCLHYVRHGNCKHGMNCWFHHPLPKASVPAPTTTTKPSPTSPSTASATSSSAAPAASSPVASAAPPVSAEAIQKAIDARWNPAESPLTWLANRAAAILGTHSSQGSPVSSNSRPQLHTLPSARLGLRLRLAWTSRTMHREKEYPAFRTLSTILRDPPYMVTEMDSSAPSSPNVRLDVAALLTWHQQRISKAPATPIATVAVAAAVIASAPPRSSATTSKEEAPSAVTVPVISTQAATNPASVTSTTSEPSKSEHAVAELSRRDPEESALSTSRSMASVQPAAEIKPSSSTFESGGKNSSTTSALFNSTMSVEATVPITSSAASGNSICPLTAAAVLPLPPVAEMFTVNSSNPSVQPPVPIASSIASGSSSASTAAAVLSLLSADEVSTAGKNSSQSVEASVPSVGISTTTSVLPLPLVAKALLSVPCTRQAGLQSEPATASTSSQSSASELITKGAQTQSQGSYKEAPATAVPTLSPHSSLMHTNTNNAAVFNASPRVTLSLSTSTTPIPSMTNCFPPAPFFDLGSSSSYASFTNQPTTIVSTPAEAAHASAHDRAAWPIHEVPTTPPLVTVVTSSTEPAYASLCTHLSLVPWLSLCLQLPVELEPSSPNTDSRMSPRLLSVYLPAASNTRNVPIVVRSLEGQTIQQQGYRNAGGFGSVMGAAGSASSVHGSSDRGGGSSAVGNSGSPAGATGSTPNSDSGTARGDSSTMGGSGGRAGGDCSSATASGTQCSVLNREMNGLLSACCALVYVLDLENAGTDRAVEMVCGLAEALESRSVLKIVHDAPMVGAILASSYGILLNGVLDTQVAAGLASLALSGSLAAPAALSRPSLEEALLRLPAAPAWLVEEVLNQESRPEKAASLSDTAARGVGWRLLATLYLARWSQTAGGLLALGATYLMHAPLSLDWLTGARAVQSTGVSAGGQGPGKSSAEIGGDVPLNVDMMSERDDLQSTRDSPAGTALEAELGSSEQPQRCAEQQVGQEQPHHHHQCQQQQQKQEEEEEEEQQGVGVNEGTFAAVEEIAESPLKAEARSFEDQLQRETGLLEVQQQVLEQHELRERQEQREAGLRGIENFMTSAPNELEKCALEVEFEVSDQQQQQQQYTDLSSTAECTVGMIDDQRDEVALEVNMLRTCPEHMIETMDVRPDDSTLHVNSNHMDKGMGDEPSEVLLEGSVSSTEEHAVGNVDDAPEESAVDVIVSDMADGTTGVLGDELGGTIPQGNPSSVGENTVATLDVGLGKVAVEATLGIEE